MSLDPMSQVEVLDFITALADRVEANPKLAVHPDFIKVSRLALAASQLRPDKGSSVAPFDYSIITQSIESLRDNQPNLTEICQTLLNQGLVVEPQKLTSLTEAHEVALAQCKSELLCAKTELQEAESQITHLEARVAEVESLNQDLRLEIAANAEKMVALTENGKILQGRLDKVEGDRVGSNAAMRKMVEAIQWSTGSPTYKDKRNQPYRCCPMCLGLDPATLNPHPDVGHKPDCRIAKLLALL